MAANKTRSELQAYFNTGDKPTQSNFEDLIQSNLNLSEGGTFQAECTIAHAGKAKSTGTMREVIRQSADDNQEIDLTVAQCGALVLMDENEAYTMNLPAIEDGNIGCSFQFVETVISNTLRKVVTKYDNDYFVGGVTNTFDTTGDTDGLVTFVSTGGTDTTISFDDDLDNCGGGLGANVTVTAILEGNTTNGGGAKLVWAVTGNAIAKELADTGAAIFS